jgi:uncharacterized membrane protein
MGIAARPEGEFTDERAGTARLEAFSDGVFAIAITLLVLEIAVPAARQGDLLHHLLDLWPKYAAYAISFVTIGVMWANHHGLMRYAARIDAGLIYRNLFLLGVVSFIPFPTAVLGDYLKRTPEQADAGITAGGHNAQVAIGLYGLVMVLLAVAFTLLWQRLYSRPALLRSPTLIPAVATELRRSGLGLLAYVIATAISVVVPALALAIYAVLVVVFAIAAGRQAVAGVVDG